MAAFSRLLLSGSTSGKPIPVVATATAGTLIHTAVTGAVSFDALYLWVSNVTASDASLTLEWGGVGDPGDHLFKALNIVAKTRVLIADGLMLNGGLLVRAFSGTASALNITGYVNRIA